jgi:ral guanine nucleotide dissociation stimulator-like 1
MFVILSFCPCAASKMALTVGFVLQDSDDEISHLEWETVRVRFVKAGTLKKLVEALSTDDGELETTYINVFLATYRSFSTPREVLKLLLQRYEELSDSPPNGKIDQHEQHRKTLISALHVWLDSYPEDFKDPPNHTALTHLLHFCEEFLPATELHAKVQHRLDRYSREAQADPLLVPPPAFALRAAAAGWRVYKLPDVPVRHFAEQLTRMDVVSHCYNLQTSLRSVNGFSKFTHFFNFDMWTC